MDSNLVRILFVEPFGQHEGHPPVESKRITDILTEVGVQVTLVTFDGVRGDWIKSSRVERHVSVVSQSGPFAGLLRLIPKLWHFLLARFVAGFLETLFTLLLAARESRKKSYNAVHFLDADPLFLLPLAATMFTRNCNFVVNSYSIPIGWEIKNYRQEFTQSLRRRSYRSCAHLALAWLINNKGITLLHRFIYNRGMRRNRFSFICHTTELKEAYKAYLGGIIYDKIHVIPLGRIPPEPEVMSQKQARQYLGLPEEAKIFLFFGSNHLGKNLEVIFQAVQGMPKVVYLLFAGRVFEGSQSRNPTLLAQNRGWAENTIVVDKFVPGEEVAYYFYASDTIIMSHVKTYIASASVLNEACRFSLPVIASDAGQLGEYVRGYNLGLAFIPEDPDSLRQSIDSFLNLSDEERLAMKTNFHRFAADLSWTEVVNRYIALY